MTSPATVRPPGVLTASGPETVPGAMVAVSDVALAAVTVASWLFTTTRSSREVGRILVPLIVNELAVESRTGGDVLVTVGAVLPATNVCVLVTVLAPTVTDTVPGDAPPGTTTSRRVAVADETAAVVPLNLTVLLAGVVEK